MGHSTSTVSSAGSTGSSGARHSRDAKPRSAKNHTWGEAEFAATRWSVVLAAGGNRSAEQTKQALEQLIRAYWFPLYAFLRRQGKQSAQAEDLVQGFLTRLLEKGDLARIDRAKGKFRSFLLASIKHYLVNEYHKSRAVKRGGTTPIIAIDSLDAEARYAFEPADNTTPESLFDRRWALEVLDRVLARLRQEYIDAGKAPLFEAIKDCLAPQRDHLSYAQRAQQLGISAQSLGTMVHRMRRRYRDLLRREIAQTVDSPAQVDEEIAYLMNCL